MNELIIAGTDIRRDAEGRFSLNDLHRAAGGEGRHQPSNWLRLDTTTGLIEEISNSSDLRSSPVGSEAGRYGGTYVIKELVYAYAMWISPAFHLRVIRAYDAMVSQPQVDPISLLGDPAAMRGLLLTYSEKVLELQDKVAEQAPKIAAHNRLMDAEGSLSLREAAKAVEVPERRFIQELHARGWIFKPHGSATWLGYSDKTKAGWLTHKVHMAKRSDGTDKVCEQVRVTPSGVAKLAGMFQDVTA